MELEFALVLQVGKKFHTATFAIPHCTNMLFLWILLITLE